MRMSTSIPRPGTNTVGPDFDDDIIVEILLKLPAKSLLRFRCVCKSWRALISDPSFVRNHLRRVNTNHFNLLVGTRWFSQADVISKQDDGGIAITELDYPVTFSDPGCFMIYGSCNGLVCAGFENGNIIIWNPLTREFKQLPQPEGGSTHLEGDRYVALAGFGYDSTIEDYKVIRVTRVFDYDTTLQVFTLKTGSWRTNLEFNHIRLRYYNTRSQTPGFLLNETLHWVAKLRGSEYEEGTMGIVTIGLADERFQEYGVEESWTEVIYIYPEDLPQGFSFYLAPICILDNGEVLLNCRKDLGLYDPERERYRNVIWTCEVPCPLYVSYVETLISPQNGICESENNIASTLENKGARMEVLSFNIPAPSGWSKKGRKTKRGRWSHQRRSNSTPCLNIHSQLAPTNSNDPSSS
uniref:F-box/kelch-repeat protein At3g23880-like isoform X2 n=1 Tax=Fragaria vesca subsp. vesca TaxID=101020 RepID=UPI0005CA76EC|nr:PREDICTED: F-box/kelch-repeat protein At3g23880-like isoform X2 [Fragaria vesca subsp. vesca]